MGSLGTALTRHVPNVTRPCAIFDVYCEGSFADIGSSVIILPPFFFFFYCYKIKTFSLRLPVTFEMGNMMNYGTFALPCFIKIIRDDA